MPPAFSPLFATNDEAGQTCIFFGYGLTRGAAVTVTNGAVTQLAGWQWNGGNGRLRWGAKLFRKTVLKSGPRTPWWRFGRA